MPTLNSVLGPVSDVIGTLILVTVAPAPVNGIAFEAVKAEQVQEQSPLKTPSVTYPYQETNRALASLLKLLNVAFATSGNTLRWPGAPAFPIGIAARMR